MSPTVHPRSRGEHEVRAATHMRMRGSSPLARGTLPHALGDPQAERFIPARAGNTRGAPPRSETDTVHPRSRGEHRLCRERENAGCGSSPLARGTRPPSRCSPPRHRFIPARAGNTGRGGTAPGAGPVHPRSRGEHQNPLLGTLQPAGSSPLARGTHRQPDGLGRAPRFIPARAGNTGRRRTRPRPSPVHPRSRGEHEIGRTPIAFGNGSSPLARGTRPCGRCPPHCRRFIPARAGNT